MARNQDLMAAIKERIYQSLMDLKDEHEKKPGKQTKCEGQLILKYPFGVFKSPKIPTKCFFRISFPKSQTKSK